MLVVLTSEASIALPVVARTLGATFLGRRVACISSAAVVYPERSWVAAEQDVLTRLGAETFEVELSTLSNAEAHAKLEDSEAIFVHGGNTFFLLQEMQRVGFKAFVEVYLSSGRPYIGSSAGSIVAGPRIDVIAATDDPSKAPSVDPRRGLDLVDVVPMVHFDLAGYREAFRLSFEVAIATGTNVLPLRNDQFVVSRDRKLELVTGGG